MNELRDRVTVRLDAAAVGNRLDVAVVAALEDEGHVLTRSALARSFAAGGVTLDGRPAKPGRTVDAPQTVEVELPRAEPLRARPQPMDLTIVHEDDDVLVVDKPAGVVVHPGPGHATGTLVSGVLHHLQRELPTLPGNDQTRPGVVHRIDRETSGLLVFAKNPRAQEHLASQFRAHGVERSYLGVVAGDVAFDACRVQTWHGRDPADRRRFSPRVETRRAVSNVEVEQRLGIATVLRFRLETGRTHQVRMHCRHLGHPILADALYGRRQRGALAVAMAGLNRHALHAEILGFDHPAGTGLLRLKAPWPGDLGALLGRLRAAGVS